MRLCHVLSDLLSEGQHDERSNSVADERGHHQDETCKDDKDAVQTHALYTTGNGFRNSMEQTGRVDGLSKRQTPGSEYDDGPQEVIEIFFVQDTSTEEEYDGNDGDDTHVTEDQLQLMTDAPKYNCGEGNDTDEPLSGTEFIVDGFDRHDGSVLSGLKRDE